jgi:hypothetical protein
LFAVFSRRIPSKAMSKTGKGESNRAGLHAKIAESHPILCNATNKPGTKANLSAFCPSE